MGTTTGSITVGCETMQQCVTVFWARYDGLGGVGSPEAAASIDLQCQHERSCADAYHTHCPVNRMRQRLGGPSA